MQARFFNLDALRGYAIFTMILSGSIAYGDILPAWMFHAQVPPPAHQFNPDLPGITWVDLVFPFFIFCMGAAVPAALHKYVATNKYKAVIINAFRRFALLCFFALLLEHFKSERISASPDVVIYFLTIAGFILLLLSFTKWGSIFEAATEKYFNYIGIFLGLLAFIFLPFNNGLGFSVKSSDIIIIVLANMALFGTLIWWFTRNNQIARLAILPFIMALFLTGKMPNTWNEWLFTLTPEAGIYRFYFLKYLFIFIPGTIAGDWLLKHKDFSVEEIKTNRLIKLIAAILLSVIVTNVIFLFTRALITNLIVTSLLLMLVHLLIHKNHLPNKPLLQKLTAAGTYCLLLGLFFEAYEGGIKKDFSTYSYYFVTSGLAFFALIVLAVLPSFSVGKPIHRFFVLTGQNSMMAYVSGTLLLLPIMKITGLYAYWSAMNNNIFMGCMKGIIYTLFVCLFTFPFTKKGLVWKT